MAASGCTPGSRLGRGATSGAIEEAGEQVRQLEAQGKRVPFERAAGNSVKGALNELDEPERSAELGRIVGVATESAVTSALGTLQNQGAWGGGPGTTGTPLGSVGSQFSSGFAEGMSRQLRLELGPQGDGALSASLSGLARQMSTAAASGAVAEISPLDPSCTGPHRKRCVEDRVYELSQRAALGFADGLAQGLRVPSLVVAFVAGLALAAAIALAMRMWGDRPIR
jgi:hypothetical protein